jgi:hypothetical protein
MPRKSFSLSFEVLGGGGEGLGVICNTGRIGLDQDIPGLTESTDEVHIWWPGGRPWARANASGAGLGNTHPDRKVPKSDGSTGYVRICCARELARALTFRR